MTRRLTPGRVLLYALLILVIVAYVIPLAVMLSTSLKANSEVLTPVWRWIPHRPTLEQYTFILRQFPFLRWVANSLIVMGGTVALALAVSLPAGYAFARLHFRGRDLLFGLSLLTIMIPFFAYIPQLYLMFFYLKLTNTHMALIIPLSTSAVNLFLLRQFMLQLPKELDEAAAIDGANHWQIFWQVILPLCKPAIVTVIIFTAVRSWNSLMWPLIAASTDKVKTLPVGLAINVFTATTGVARQQPYGVVMAAAFLSILLPVTVFIVLQRYFVQGVATTGLK
jgi:ABC-type glycerol-3-phosphate transport system permease component